MNIKDIKIKLTNSQEPNTIICTVESEKWFWEQLKRLEYLEKEYDHYNLTYFDGKTQDYYNDKIDKLNKEVTRLKDMNVKFMCGTWRFNGNNKDNTFNSGSFANSERVCNKTSEEKSTDSDDRAAKNGVCGPLYIQ